MQIDLDFVWWSKSPRFQCGGSNLTWFQCSMKRISLLCGLSKITSLQCGGSALIWFLFSGRKIHVFGVRIEIHWGFFVGASISTWYKSGDQSWHDFSDEVEITFFMCGIETDMVLASGSNLTCFLCGGQNRNWFYVRAENCLVSINGSKLTCSLAWGSKLALVLVCGSKMTCLWYRDRLT